MKLSNHHIDRSLRDAVKDYSPGIPMPWNEISPLIKRRKRFRFLFFLIPALIILSATAYGLYLSQGSIEEKVFNELKVMTSEGLSSLRDSKGNPDLSGLQQENDAVKAEADIEKSAETVITYNSGAAIKDKHIKKPGKALNTVSSGESGNNKSIRNDAPRDAESPLTNPSGNARYFPLVLSSRIILGSIQTTALSKTVPGLIVPGRPAVKAFSYKRFYGGLAYRMESMIPKASFDYDPEKIHQDFEKVIRQQLPAIKSNTYAIEFGYLLSSNSGVESGLGLARYEQSFNFSYVYNRAPLYDGSTGKIVGYFELNDTTSKYYNFQNNRSLSVLQIPLNVFHRIPLGRRLYAQALTGLQMNIVTAAAGKNVDIQKLELSELSKEDYKSAMSARVSGALFYLLNQYSSIGVEASYYTYLTSIYHSEYYLIRPTIKSMQMSFKLNF